MIEQANAAGYELPADDLPPQIDDGLDFIHTAFWRLSPDRAVGMGLGAIPFTAINAYAERYGVDDVDDFERFCELISRIDAAFLKIKNEK